jgi:nicotinamidase-related amidase
MSDPINHLGLLCIDMQDAFLKVIPRSESLIKRNRFALEAAKLLGLSVVVTEQIPEKLGPTNREISDALPENTPIFGKSAFSSMEAEGMNRWIESNQIDHLLIIGIEVPICVYQTAVQALSEDLGVTLLADCLGQRRCEDQEPVLKQLLNMDAHILPSETVFYSLLGSAEHPKFRDYTKLVKEFSV